MKGRENMEVAGTRHSVRLKLKIDQLKA